MGARQEPTGQARERVKTEVVALEGMMQGMGLALESTPYGVQVIKLKTSQATSDPAPKQSQQAQPTSSGMQCREASSTADTEAGLPLRMPSTRFFHLSRKRDNRGKCECYGGRNNGVSY